MSFSEDEDIDSTNFSEKVLHLAWETNDDVLAVCGSNRLYIYSGVRDSLSGCLSRHAGALKYKKNDVSSSAANLHKVGISREEMTKHHHLMEIDSK